MEFQKSYTAYQHLWKRGEKVVLKSGISLELIEIMVRENIEVDTKNEKTIIWFLSPEKKRVLKNKTLTIDACISWHMGLPFYNIRCGKENKYIAEFYLEKRTEK